jgi:hypothetical protein
VIFGKVIQEGGHMDSLLLGVLAAAMAVAGIVFG